MNGRRVKLFWMGLAALLVFLGFNKQLDLQTAFTFLAKDFAKATGWYENRRIVQGLTVRDNLRRLGDNRQEDFAIAV